MSPRPAARCYSPACASPPASRPWRMSRSTTARPWCANASPSTHPSPEPGPAHHRRRTPEPLSPPGPTRPDGQLLRRTPTHQRRRAATLLMQSTAALGYETSQELGGSCANTRDSDIVSPAPSGRGCPIRSVRAAAAQQVGGNCETCSPVRRQFFDAGQFDDPEWAWVGDRRMFVVGHTPGGAPFGCFEDELDDLG